jgi:cytochrome oxidase Cu insertion factor (SCO1/SenC/PrrC family)
MPGRSGPVSVLAFAAPAQDADVEHLETQSPLARQQPARCNRRQWLGRVLVPAACCLNPAAAQPAGADLYRNATAWLDDQSQPWRMEALRGRYTVLTLAYGACRRICSTSLRVMENLQTLADARQQPLDFVVIGLDPVEDKPADWAALRRDRHMTRANWHFLWGDERATRAVAQQLGVNVWRADQHLMHDYKIVLLAPQGQLLKSVERFDQAPDALLP